MVGNAFMVESDCALYHYKLAYEGEYIDEDKQKTLKWDDPSIGIKWDCKNPILFLRRISKKFRIFSLFLLDKPP